MEREFKRGEVYWARMDNGWGSEQSAARPVVIISSDQGNATCPTVMAVFMSTKPKYGRINVQTEVTGNRSWIMCNQIRSLDKERLTYIGSLSYEEIMEVDAALRVAMDLEGGEDKGEIEKLEARIKELEAQVSGFEEERTKIAVENTVKNDMLQRLYDKAINELVAVKVTGDIDRLTKIAEETKINKVAVPNVVEKPAVKPAEETKINKVEINTCSMEDLHRVGCNARQITSIIANRPYKSVDDLRRVPWVTNTAYAILKTKVCCEPVVEKPRFKMKPAPESVKGSAKVNVNTCTWEELVEKTGISAETAKTVCRYRAKNGPFKKIEDLLNVARFGNGCLKRYGSKLEV